MNIVGLIARPLYWLAGKMFALWARPTIQPESPAELISDDKVAVCYRQSGDKYLLVEYGPLVLDLTADDLD